MPAVHIITGSTSGLGLASVQRLAQKTDGLIIAGVRNPAAAQHLKQLVPNGRLELLRLDTASPDVVQSFVETVIERLGTQKIASLSCIAGLQILGPQGMTKNGIDETFATNVMGHLQLIDGLRDHLAPEAAVVTIGSGTHIPGNKLAARAGFAGSDYVSAAGCAKGESTKPERDELGRALDRYATSKLCAIFLAAALADDPAYSGIRAYCLDPGLMPGTGLARQQTAVVRFVWKRIMPVLASFVEGVSSPTRSAQMLVDGLILGEQEYPSGSHVEFTGKPAPASEEASDSSVAKRFLVDARALLQEAGA